MEKEHLFILIVAIVGIIAMVIMSMSFARDTGGFLSDGNNGGMAIRAVRSPTPISQFETDRCKDSDGGFDLNTQGTITGRENGAPIKNAYGGPVMDTCIGKDVFEWYCNGVKKDYKVFSCPTGQFCRNGECISP